MMLLDTHPLIWFSQGDARLGVQACRFIEESVAAGKCLVSPISFWEIAMLAGKGRIALGRPVLEWTHEILRGGFGLAPVLPEIAIDAGQLPRGIHGDPADRIIVATARARACPLVTADRQILACAAEGHVQAIDARR